MIMTSKKVAIREGRQRGQKPEQQHGENKRARGDNGEECDDTMIKLQGAPEVKEINPDAAIGSPAPDGGSSSSGGSKRWDDMGPTFEPMACAMDSGTQPP